MTHLPQPVIDALSQTRTIAMIGASTRPFRPSHGVMRYLVEAGLRVIPVNPRHAGETLFGETVLPDMASVREEVEMIDVFRRSEALPALVEAALLRWPDLGTVWMQLGVANAAAREMAERRGVRVIEDRCLKIDHLAWTRA
jgi:predicted CoA-binding protein